jgi:predicted nucleic acid-binding Zn ribbon protein
LRRAVRVVRVVLVPTYVYETIPADAATKPLLFEVQQKMADAPLTQHPETGEPVRRVLTAPFLGGMSHKSDAPAAGEEPSAAGCGMGMCGMGGCGGLGEA